MKIGGIGFVYMITSPSGRIYIGSTIDPDQRFEFYKSLGCKDQPKLYNSLNKYGTKNHKFEIIWAGDILEMFKYETLIGWSFNVLDKDIGLNLRLPKYGEVYSCVSEETRLKLSIANSGKLPSIECRKRAIEVSIGNKYRLNKKHSKEAKEKISLKTKERFSSIEYKKKISRIIFQLDLEGNFIKEWDSCKIASITLNISKGNITNCCRGNRNHTGGFKWKYKNNES